MKISAVLFVFAALTTYSNGQFPPYIKLCKRNLNINECVKENILVAQKYVKEGIPKLFVLPTNPFKVTQVSVQTPTLDVDLSKFTAKGIDKFEVKDLNIDLDNNIFEIDVNIKWIEASTLYKFNGKLIGIQLNAEGQAYGNMTDMDIKLSLRGRRFMRDGKPYINFGDKKVKIAFDKAFISFEDLFPVPELTEITNRVFNNNIKEVVYELQPLIEECLVVIISNSITKLFEKYSIDELFPL